MTPISADDNFPRRRLDVLGSHLAYIDEGRGDPIVFLHGNPTSSYLWRNVIPHVQPLGRVIAPDLIGMGASGKPDIAYRFADHARYLGAFLDALELRNITFVLHDWGSALGFDWAMRNPDRVRALAFMEAILTPIPSWEQFGGSPVRETFQGFRTPGVGERMILDENVFIERMLPGATLRPLTDAEMERYRAPFHERASRKPMLAWPREIPIAGEPADVVATVCTYRDKLMASPLPKLLFTAEPGGIVRAELVAWARANLPNLEVVPIGAGIHYVQEDHPHEIGEALARWISAGAARAGRA
jgi:haloalkane dehalogenase